MALFNLQWLRSSLILCQDLFCSLREALLRLRLLRKALKSRWTSQTFERSFGVSSELGSGSQTGEASAASISFSSSSVRAWQVS